MARLRLALDETTEALEAVDRAIQLAPEDPRSLAIASRALSLLGRHDEAVTMAYRAVIAEPQNPLWHDRVAWALLAADRQFADAEQAARTAIGLDPNEAHYYFTHGVALDALGHLDQARQALLISLRMEPENPVAQHRLAVLNGEVSREPERKKRTFRLFGKRSSLPAPDEQPDQPARADDEAEADQPVEDHGRHRGRGGQAARDQAEDERAVDHAEPARHDRHAGRGHPGAVRDQQVDRVDPVARPPRRSTSTGRARRGASSAAPAAPRPRS